MLTFLLPVAGYLIGSVSSAVIVSKLMGLEDPRSSGSGNPGATNVLRLGGKKAAAITLIFDIVKGLAPVLIARQFTDDGWIIGLTGLAAFLGHLFPLFFGFKGGKGVATALGVLFGFSGWLGLGAVIIWLLFALSSKYSSLGSLVTMGLAPILSSILAPGWGYLLATFAMAVFVYLRHSENIKRLRDGTESKINLGGKKKEDANSAKTSSVEDPPDSSAR